MMSERLNNKEMNLRCITVHDLVKVTGGNESTGDYFVYLIDTERCFGCGNCESVCPTGAIKVYTYGWRDGTAEIDLNSCVDCKSCLNTCVVDAIVRK